MKPKEYNVLQQAVETGVLRGWNRAHKHVDTPSPESVREEIEQAVMAEICEWFDFEPTPGEVADRIARSVSLHTESPR